MLNSNTKKYHKILNKKSRKLNKKKRKVNKKSRKNKGGTSRGLLPRDVHHVLKTDDLVKVLEKSNVEIDDVLISTNNNNPNPKKHYEWRVKVEPLVPNSNIKVIGTPQYKLYNKTNSRWRTRLPRSFARPQQGIDIPSWTTVNSSIMMANESDSD